MTDDRGASITGFGVTQLVTSTNSKRRLKNLHKKEKSEDISGEGEENINDAQRKRKLTTKIT